MIDWLMTPEVQATPHHWWATFGGHAAVGVALWAFWAALAWVFKMLPGETGIQMTGASYAIWEAMQGYLGGYDLIDMAVDWAAVTGGAAVAWALWSRRAVMVGAVIALVALAGFAGAADAKNRKWGGPKA
jgi:hypothetical protein